MLQPLGTGILVSQSSISMIQGTNQYVVTGVIMSVGSNVSGVTVGSNVLLPQNQAFQIYYNNAQYWWTDFNNALLIE